MCIELIFYKTKKQKRLFALKWENSLRSKFGKTQTKVELLLSPLFPKSNQACILSSKKIVLLLHYG